MIKTGKWYESSYPVCCWYKGEGGHKVVCFGIFTHSSLTQTFETDAKKQRHMDAYCRNINKYRNCPIARMLAGCEAHREEQR